MKVCLVDSCCPESHLGSKPPSPPAEDVAQRDRDRLALLLTRLAESGRPELLARAREALR